MKAQISMSLLIASIQAVTGCGAQPTEARTVIPLTEQITLDDLGVLGTGSLCYLSNGDLAVLDNVAQEVYILRDGEEVAKVSSIGGGPLEYTSPTELAPRPGGGFVLNCAPNKKILLYDETYQCTGEILFFDQTLRPGTPVRLRMVSDSTLVGVDYIFDEVSGCGTRLSLWNFSNPESPERLYTYHTRLTENVHPLNYLIKTAILFDVNVDEETVFFADATADEFRVEVVSLDNRPLNAIISDVTPLRKTQEDLDTETERLRSAWIRGTGSEAGFDYEPQEFHNTIQGLFCSPDGTLWVRRGTLFNLDFDIYDTNLELVDQVSFSAPSSQEFDGWLVALGVGEIAVAPLNPAEENVIHTGNYKLYGAISRCKYRCFLRVNVATLIGDNGRCWTGQLLKKELW